MKQCYTRLILLGILSIAACNNKPCHNLILQDNPSCYEVKVTCRGLGESDARIQSGQPGFVSLSITPIKDSSLDISALLYKPVLITLERPDGTQIFLPRNSWVISERSKTIKVSLDPQHLGTKPGSIRFRVEAGLYEGISEAYECRIWEAPTFGAGTDTVSYPMSKQVGTAKAPAEEPLSLQIGTFQGRPGLFVTERIGFPRDGLWTEHYIWDAGKLSSNEREPWKKLRESSAGVTNYDDLYAITSNNHVFYAARENKMIANTPEGKRAAEFAVKCIPPANTFCLTGNPISLAASDINDTILLSEPTAIHAYGFNGVQFFYLSRFEGIPQKHLEIAMQSKHGDAIDETKAFDAAVWNSTGQLMLFTIKNGILDIHPLSLETSAFLQNELKGQSLEAFGFGDIDRDGLQDLVILGSFDEEIQWAPQLTSPEGRSFFGKLRSTGIRQTPGAVTSLRVGDINGDGKADIALLKSKAISVYLQ